MLVYNMAKNQDTVIIISDDESDEPSPPIVHTIKPPIQKWGYSKSNPIDLDMDDDDGGGDDQIPAPPINTMEQHKKIPTKYEHQLSSTSRTSKNVTHRQATTMDLDSTNASLQSIPTASPMVISLSDNPVYKSKANLFGLTADVFEYINDQICIEPEISMEEEPDWSYIANLGVVEDSKPWEPPRHEAPPPTTTKIPDGMSINELFTRLDYYQYSMNQYVQGLQPKVSKETISKSPSPSTSTTGVLTPSPTSSGRTTAKRNTAAHSHTYMSGAVAVNKMDHQSILTRLLETAHLTTLQRPYVPVAVWQGSNWEDWAQFSPGDLIHVPFTEAEDEVVKKMANRSKDKKRKGIPLVEDFGIWSEAPTLLPGRQPEDCCYRNMDIVLERSHLFPKPQLITKAKAPSKNLQSYHKLLSCRQMSGKGSMNKYHSAIWKNLRTEATIGEGSGDASCLLLEGDISITNSLQVIAGSLCDDNQSYNMEGNLREWRSSTQKVTQMKGHFNQVTTADGGNQVSWRTVHDIKTSNDKSMIFSASRDEVAKIWNRETKKLISTLVCHHGPVHQISVKPGNENVIATGSADGSGVIWKVLGGGKSGEGFVCTTEVVDDLYYCSAECLEFGHDASSDKLFMGYRTEITEKLGWITAFDARTTTPLYDIRDMRGSVGCMSISQSGKYILSGNDSIDGGDQMLHVNDTMTGESVLKARTGHLDVNCVAFSRCDHYIASGSVNNQISIFDRRKADKPVYSFLHDNTRQNNDRFIAPDAGIGISGMYWMKNNNILITAGGDCAVNLWDVSGGDGLLKSYKAADPISCLAVNEDLHTLAAGASGSQGLVHVWRP